MNEGISTPSHGEGALPEAGGLPPQAVPAVKKFFLIEYMEEVVRGFKWMRAAPKAEQHIVTKVTKGLQNWSKLRKARIGMAVVVVIIVAASGLFAGQASSVPTKPPDQRVGPGATGHNASFTVGGTVTENGNTSVAQAFETSRFSALKITLTWSDEAAGFPLRTNQPDELGFAVVAPNGANWTAAKKPNPPGMPGQVEWTLGENSTDYGTGPWTIDVEGGTMGDVVKTSGNPVCLAGCRADTSQGFSLKIEAAW